MFYSVSRSQSNARLSKSSGYNDVHKYLPINPLSPFVLDNSRFATHQLPMQSWIIRVLQHISYLCIYGQARISCYDLKSEHGERMQTIIATSESLYNK
jgi:hypothetical protein